MQNVMIVSMCFVLIGCTAGSIHKEFTVDSEEPTSLSLDARQRLVITTSQGGSTGDRKVVCAEPSPDVFSALAASLSASAGASLTTPQGGGSESISIAGGLAESAGALGERTQTIQVLRDGMYRACEAYLNGLIGKEEYKRILVSYDEVLIALVALEGLSRSRMPVMNIIGTNSGVAQGGEEGDDINQRSVFGDNKVIKIEDLPAIEAETARAMEKIVKHYYCMQLAFKKEVNEKILDRFCS